MSWMTLDLRGGKTSFKPGESVEGSVRWELDAPPSKVEVRLFWYTRGKGTEDVAVEGSAAWESPSNAEKREFALNLPEAPYSFSGKLISVLWAVEAVVEPPSEVARVEIVVSPSGAEVVLPVLTEEQTKTPFPFNRGGS